jgi:hypothetical protein
MVGWSERIRTHAFPIEPGLRQDNGRNRESSSNPFRSPIMKIVSADAALQGGPPAFRYVGY